MFLAEETVRQEVLNMYQQQSGYIKYLNARIFPRAKLTLEDPSRRGEVEPKQSGLVAYPQIVPYL